MDNRMITTNSKRIMAGNIVLLAAIFVLTFGCWNEIKWYDFVAPLGTVVSFVALVVVILCYVDINKLIRDKQAYIVLAGCVVAFVNILIVHSGIGAFFTAADVLLSLYLADKIIMPRKMLIWTGLYLAFFFFYWTFDVKGYFKGYNTNYGGLVLITGFVFTVIIITLLRERYVASGNKAASVAMVLLLIYMFAWGYNIISWYRARCALLGLVIVAILLLVPKKLWASKLVYSVLTFGTTIGAIAISGVYILLGKMKDVFTIRIFYKDILSGRDEIWSELWDAYLSKPLTGIGSSYEMKLEWMDGMFEVHNGLLDILIVHGAIVFVLVAYMLIKGMFSMQTAVANSRTAAAAMAGIMAVLGASFMENFFIVPPFLLCFLILIVFVREADLLVSGNNKNEVTKNGLV